MPACTSKPALVEVKSEGEIERCNEHTCLLMSTTVRDHQGERKEAGTLALLNKPDHKDDQSI
jgi:hypothetical protein